MELHSDKRAPRASPVTVAGTLCSHQRWRPYFMSLASDSAALQTPDQATLLLRRHSTVDLACFIAKTCCLMSSFYGLPHGPCECVVGVALRVLRRICAQKCPAAAQFPSCGLGSWMLPDRQRATAPHKPLRRWLGNKQNTCSSPCWCANFVFRITQYPFKY